MSSSETIEITNKSSSMDKILTSIVEIGGEGKSENLNNSAHELNAHVQSSPQGYVNENAHEDAHEDNQVDEDGYEDSHEDDHDLEEMPSAATTSTSATSTTVNTNTATDQLRELDPPRFVSRDSIFSYDDPSESEFAELEVQLNDQDLSMKSNSNSNININSNISSTSNSFSDNCFVSAQSPVHVPDHGKEKLGHEVSTQTDTNMNVNTEVDVDLDVVGHTLSSIQLQINSRCSTDPISEIESETCEGSLSIHGHSHSQSESRINNTNELQHDNSEELSCEEGCFSLSDSADTITFSYKDNNNDNVTHTTGGKDDVTETDTKTGDCIEIEIQTDTEACKVNEANTIDPDENKNEDESVIENCENLVSISCEDILPSTSGHFIENDSETNNILPATPLDEEEIEDELPPFKQDNSTSTMETENCEDNLSSGSEHLMEDNNETNNILHATPLDEEETEDEPCEQDSSISTMETENGEGSDFLVASLNDQNVDTNNNSSPGPIYLNKETLSIIQEHQHCYLDSNSDSSTSGGKRVDKYAIYEQSELGNQVADIKMNNNERGSLLDSISYSDEEEAEANKDDCREQGYNNNNSPGLTETDVEDDDEDSEASNDTLTEKSNSSDRTRERKGMFTCAGQICSISDNGGKLERDLKEEDINKNIAREIATSFHVDQIERSVDEIDGFNSSYTESDEDIKESSGNTKNENKSNRDSKSSSRRVSFNSNPVKSIHELERCNQEEKASMFYTSKDLTKFRVDYLIELQEMQERLEKQKSSGSTLLRTLAAKFSEIISCKPLIDLCCANHNRATI